MLTTTTLSPPSSPPLAGTSLTLNAGEDSQRGCVVDSVGGHLYIGIATTPSKIVKVATSTFTRVGALSTTNGAYGMAIDDQAQYLYCATGQTGTSTLRYTCQTTS